LVNLIPAGLEILDDDFGFRCLGDGKCGGSGEGEEGFSHDGALENVANGKIYTTNKEGERPSVAEFFEQFKRCA
jgi:hypothetical protein